MRSADQELGFRLLATMLKSALPLLSALKTCAEQSPRRAAGVWRELAAGVERGEMFVGAMARSRQFDGYVLALVSVGEETGELDRTLTAAADSLLRRREHRAMVVNALFYPVLVMLLTAGVVAFMAIKVIPALKLFLDAQHQKLPAMTLMLVDFSDAVRLYAPAAVTGLALGVWALLLARRHPAVREWTDAALLRLPVIGGVLRLSATAVLARGLAMLLESGLTLVTALKTVEGLFGNRRVRRRLAEARERVLAGSAFGTALGEAREFLPMLRQLASVGEATGTLAAAMGEVADFHEARLQAVIRRLGMIVEPVMIVTVGLIVGFVYIAFFLAIFSLAGG